MKSKESISQEQKSEEVLDKSESIVECSTCLGKRFEPHGNDFICLYCGAIIDGPWPK